ncbi:M56 family metallopeptidase [Barnesiella sp. ET7]|uniref:M56 family metallopeptidase n=1 Tax=Barnesiella sp. ET7 TaxID=2972460 RepID=UPI0021AD1E22|nr:M56 family metallopeptidase [Barnesiella sp. ET7]MCR8910517.1 M56 family metallopeptidase [Barnesiella sp. ET7]
MDFLIYLLQVHIALSLLFIAYKALSARNTHLVTRRALLLGILLFALTYPLYRLPSVADAMPHTLQFTLPELSIAPAAAAQTPASFNLYRLGAWLYGGIALLLGLRMVIRLFSIVGLRRRGRLYREGAWRIVVCPEPIQPCSFFHWIFLPASMADPPDARATILKHEQAHIRQMHTLDILLGEVVAVLCWMNPLAWLLLKEIRLNLEYLADRAVLADEPEKRAYQYLLLDLALDNRPHASAIPFGHSFLKERIAMINRRASSTRSRYRYLLVLPLCLLLVVGSQSCRQSADHKAANSPATTTETLPQTTTLREVPEQEPVFEVAEVMPEFPGGPQALFEFIRDNLKYPQEAIDNQTEGRVILQFVVDKRGKVNNIQVKRSIDPALDRAAIDVVRALPAWKPGMQNGKQVNVRYTLPIVFKLS